MHCSKTFGKQLTYLNLGIFREEDFLFYFQSGDVAKWLKRQKNSIEIRAAIDIRLDGTAMHEKLKICLQKEKASKCPLPKRNF